MTIDELATSPADCPRPEYPRPQFRRDRWQCLNGSWDFEADQGDSGLERGILDRALSGRITVPFAPESLLSGIGDEDFHNAVWYRRTVSIPADWAGGRVLLHFQAVDYDATVWVNGKEVGRHRGGFTPFSFDITDVATPGSDATVTLRARDDHRVGKPMGKQSGLFANWSCLYTRTTGIWQTVWLEPVPQTYLERPRFTPRLGTSSLTVEAPIRGRRADLTLRVTLADSNGVVATATTSAERDMCPAVDLVIPADRLRLWDMEDPHLYDVEVALVDGSGHVVDALASYAGMRSVTIDGLAVLVNGRPVFQRLVLDQGYYPDGVLTAPSDDALLADIRLAKAAGFNGARLHQKVFEERTLYHADREGFLVWGEMPDWGIARDGADDDRIQHPVTLLTQWLESLNRDYSHPSIVGWCGLNETMQARSDRIQALDDITRGCFLAARAADRSRVVLDASGYSHRLVESDVWDSHDYEQDVSIFQANHARSATGAPFSNKPNDHQEANIPYAGQPVFVSEFGGTWWQSHRRPGDDSGGYGAAPADIDEFYKRFEGLCAALLENPGVFAYCYTQLTDVHQEQNGIAMFDRTPKFDLERLRAVQIQKAAIENGRAW